MSSDSDWKNSQREKGDARIVILPEMAQRQPELFSDLQLIRYAGKEVRVAFGDRETRRTTSTCAVYAENEEGQVFRVEIPRQAVFVKGHGRRKVFFPLPFFRGRTSLMARVSRGIGSGRIFRGR